MSARDDYPTLSWIAGERDEPGVGDHAETVIAALDEIDRLRAEINRLQAGATA